MQKKQLIHKESKRYSVGWLKHLPIREARYFGTNSRRSIIKVDAVDIDALKDSHKTRQAHLLQLHDELLNITFRTTFRSSPGMIYPGSTK